MTIARSTGGNVNFPPNRRRPPAKRHYEKALRLESSPDKRLAAMLQTAPCSVAVSGNQLKVTYLQRIGADLTVQSSTDLAGGFTATASPAKSDPQPADVTSGYEQYEVSVTPVSGRAFLRIRAIQP